MANGATERDKCIMEEMSLENAKVSDSGYSNTCSNSQSQRSSGSSISRNSNRSECSGYSGKRPSTSGSRKCPCRASKKTSGESLKRERLIVSNEVLPQPIIKENDKEQKKKKAKTISTINTETEVALKIVKAPSEITCYNVAVPTTDILDKKQEKIPAVELRDATVLDEYNGHIIINSETQFPSRIVPVDDSKSEANGKFCAVISMHDGLVLYTTPSIYAVLGYTKDAWIGQSFIGYVHPKDKATLIDQITSGMVSSREAGYKGVNDKKADLFCGLRRFTNNKYNILNEYRMDMRSNLYIPFHLSLSFHKFWDRAAEQQPKSIFLVVTARLVHSAYKAPEETIMSSVFTTRHTTTCHLCHVDPDVVHYFGYLPQDMYGRSLFDFYHPEDLPFIKNIYETVIKLEGSSFISKPYRFAVQNGGFVILETEWSSFINPWTRKLEIVIGQHRVLKGPKNPDIFHIPRRTECAYLTSISKEVLKEAKIIQNEIQALLDENIQKSSNTTQLNVPKRYKNLTSFMENLLQETEAYSLDNDELAVDESNFSGPRNPSLQEHDSVMLGDISPYHDYYDSKSSTETPPSYNQLNYNENIERFFKSKPLITTVYGSDEETINSSNDKEARKCMSPINDSGASGSYSAGNLSSDSNNQTSSASQGNTLNNVSNNNIFVTKSFKPPTLTETWLNKHNENMQKLMMQKHREFRSSIKNSDKLKDMRIKTDKINDADNSTHYIRRNHGIKRSGNHSWEGDSFKKQILKHGKVSRITTANPTNLTTTNNCISLDQSTKQTGTNINLRPPKSVTVPSSRSTQPCVPSHNINSHTTSGSPLLPLVIPVYYMPVAQVNKSTIMSSSQEKIDASLLTHPSSYVSYIAAAMGGAMYPPMIGTSLPEVVMYRPFLIPEQALVARKNQHTSNDKCPNRKRPASQATSVKAEPGSIMAMSESSKKVLSSGELLSSCMSNDGGCSSTIDLLTPILMKEHRLTDQLDNESSSSSFYSSFLYKSSDSSCNPDQKTCEASPEEHRRCHQGMRRKDPPWLEGVQLTPELIYEYQVHPKALNEVLKADMDTMKNLNQPLLVNDQLGQLYLDLETEGLAKELVLEDGITSSESDTESSNGNQTEDIPQRKHRRKMVKYDKLVMIHEENAPFPPSLQSQSISYQHS